ncbi:Uncharacterised protein [Klebsiella pneumoniae]|nr:Uncharacterised protein [Klebsiella pneumoniae]
MITLSSFYVMAYPTFIILRCFKAKVMKVRLENYVKLYFMLQEGISLSHMICL